MALTLLSRASFAQEQEAQQLLLNVEKLIQFKKILQEMYDGWKIINTSYTAIKEISSGNFNLHKKVLDALLDVSPVVKKYGRIADIIEYQLLIVKRYKAAFTQFKADHSFTAQEMAYIATVYSNLFIESVKNLDELGMVLTAGKLRMNDNERMEAIDRIYTRIEDQFSFLEDFNSSTAYLSLQRKAEMIDIKMSRKMFGY